jgi:hypothetical protein
MGFSLQGGVAPTLGVDKRQNVIGPCVDNIAPLTVCPSVAPTRETRGDPNIHSLSVIRAARRNNSVCDAAEQLNLSNSLDDVSVPIPWITDRFG